MIGTAPAAGGSTVQPDVTVIIVSYNTCDLLDACLASLAGAGRSAEIIVVDNASTDGSVAMAAHRYPHVRLVQMAGNSGFARACNAGMRLSHARYIALLNSDTVVLDCALARLVAFLDAHGEFAAAGPLLLNSDGTVQTSCFAFTTVRDIVFEQLGLTAILPNSPFFNRRGLGGFDRRAVRAVDWVSGACIIVRRDVVARVGLLDEGFFMYGEELDWCYRMKQAGLRVAFFPEARVVHHGRGSSRRGRAALAPRALAGRLRFFAKHRGERAVWLVRAVTVIGMALRLCALPLLAVLRRGDLRQRAAWYWGLLRAALTYSPLIATTSQDNR